MVANELPGWDGASVILEREGNQPAANFAFPLVTDSRDDDARSTDHRPVKATFVFNEETTQESIEALRTQIAVLKDVLAEKERQLEALQTSANDSGE